MALYHGSSPRFLHCAAQVGENCYLWGGHISEKAKKSPALSLQIFHSIKEICETKTTTGDPPPGLLEGACTTVSKSLYHFGGNDGDQFYNSLHCLDSNTLQWSEFHAAVNQPMPKSGCGMVTYLEESLSGASLIVFAGYGKPAPLTKVGGTFIPHTGTSYSDGRGWSNEMHRFNLTKREWSSPLTTGLQPPPCSNFSFTAINHHMAVLFGGVQANRGKVNDLYIIDFRSMKWTKLERPEGAPWPKGRHSHAACCLNYGEDDPQLLIIGGVYKNNKTLKDAWILDINSATWRSLGLPEGTWPRFGHTVTAYSVCPGRVRTTTFGGCPTYVYNEDSEDKIAETTVMEFESSRSSSSCDDSPTSKWVLASMVSSSKLEPPERLTKQEMKLTKTDLVCFDKVNMKNQQSHTVVVKTVDKQVQTGSSMQQQGYLRGVEIIDTTYFTYTGRAKSLEWKGFGFRMHLPANALSPGVNECQIQIKASLSGQFKFPEDTELLSSIYWITCPHKFAKAVTVEIQHCAMEPGYPQHLSSLTFIVAQCTQEDLPYQFKILDGGVFSPSSQYGSIDLTHFSGVGVAFQSVRQWLGLRAPKRYCARLYYSSSGIHSWEVYFAIIWDLELHIKAIDAKYAEAAAVVGPDQEVMFEEEQITLDIPKKGRVLESGWTITPHTYPGITKKQVDKFVPGRRVPSCQLHIKWTREQEPPPELEHTVELQGAKEPFNFFLISLPAFLASSQGLSQQTPIFISSRNGSVQQNLGSRYAGLESEPELSDLMNEVASKVSAKWKQISIQLGLTLNDQKYFMELTLGDPKQCFTFVFTVWKSRATRPHTWSTVIEALEAPAVDEMRLAQELRTKLQS